MISCIEKNAQLCQPHPTATFLIVPMGFIMFQYTFEPNVGSYDVAHDLGKLHIKMSVPQIQFLPKDLTLHSHGLGERNPEQAANPPNPE